MSVVSHHTVPYHQQNTPTYCGPATAMMILASIDGQLVQEETLWPFVHPPVGDWSASPDQLAFGLNHWAPPGFDGFFAVDRARTEHDGSLQLVKALSVEGSPPAAALVFGDAHWIVVCDVNLREKPSAGVDPSIQGFYINSASVTPIDPPRPHAADDLCAESAEYGSANANQYISYEAWQSDFFTGYTECGVQQFVTVCSDKRADLKGLSRRAGRIRNAHGFVLTTPFGGIGDPAEAQARALASIAQHELDKHGPLTSALRGITAGTPQLVHRIDVLNWYYYLIPLFQGDVGVGVARMDAVQGTFMGVSALRNERFHVLNLAELKSELSDRLPVAPELVWKPCRESTSPYYPLLSFIGERGHEFLDPSGTTYPALTPLGRGD